MVEVESQCGAPSHRRTIHSAGQPLLKQESSASTHPGDAQWTEVVPVEYLEEAPEAPKPRRRGKLWIETTSGAEGTRERRDDSPHMRLVAGDIYLLFA